MQTVYIHTHTWRGNKKYTNCICTLNHEQNIFSKQGIPLCYIWYPHQPLVHPPFQQQPKAKYFHFFRYFLNRVTAAYLSICSLKTRGPSKISDLFCIVHFLKKCSFWLRVFWSTSFFRLLAVLLFQIFGQGVHLYALMMDPKHTRD